MSASKIGSLSLTVAFFLCGCTGESESDRLQQERQKLHKARFAEVTARAAKIKVGMTRAEVQMIFTRQDGGLSGAASRYYEDPEVKIEVPYDQTGGAWKPENKVTGPVRVYRERFHGGA